jgi:hypothetical protein
MKIHENYIYLLDGKKEVKVLWKKLDKVCVMEVGKEYPSAIVDVDRLSGIPITERWLLRFGFLKKKTSPSITRYFLNNFCIEFDPQDKFRFYCNGFYIEIHHVNQLQNVFHSLTNQEL